MLVLSRKIGQEIIVGESVRITITKVSGNRVTLGVEAPDQVRILRGELSPIARDFEKDEEDNDEEIRDGLAGPARGETADTIPFVRHGAP